MLSTSQVRNAWSKQLCKEAPLSGYTFKSGGAKVNVNQNILDAVAALDYVFGMHGYLATAPDCGCFNCRQITAGNGYSLHAYGLALDINWLDNPRLRLGVVHTDMARAMIDDVYAIKTKNGLQAWQWGGDFSGSTVPDPMHFQIVVSPQDLATGIVGVSLDQIPVQPAHPIPDPVRPEFQQEINMWIQHDDGHYEEFDIYGGKLNHRWQTVLLDPESLTGWGPMPHSDDLNVAKLTAVLKENKRTDGKPAVISVMVRTTDNREFQFYYTGVEDWKRVELKSKK